MKIEKLRSELAKWQKRAKINDTQESRDFAQKKADKIEAEIAEMEKKPEGSGKKSYNDFYEELARMLEDKMEVTRSDAQAMIDVKEEAIKQRFHHEQGFTANKAYNSYWGKKEPKTNGRPKGNKPSQPKKEKTAKPAGKKPSKDECAKLLAEAKSRVAKKKALRKKWANKGKPVGGTPVDTIKKSADVIKNKALKIKDSGKTITKPQTEAITTGIEDIVKAVKKAIADRKDRELFVKRLIKALQKLI